MSEERNIYLCDGCKKTVVTVHRDEGTTPFLIDCKVTPGCPGLMESEFYRGSKDDAPTWEWYAPGAVERAALSPDVLAHVENGGLLMRRIV